MKSNKCQGIFSCYIYSQNIQLLSQELPLLGGSLLITYTINYKKTSSNFTIVNWSPKNALEYSTGAFSDSEVRKKEVFVLKRILGQLVHKQDLKALSSNTELSKNNSCRNLP